MSEIDVCGLRNFNSNALPLLSKTDKAKMDINIGDLLNKIKNDKAKKDKRQVISKQENYTCTIQGEKCNGTLLKYDNGQCSLIMRKNNITNQINFNTEKDIEKSKPSSMVRNVNDLEKRMTYEYEYHRNGKLSGSTIKNAKNVTLMETKFNEKGKIENKKIYNKNGEFTREVKYKYGKDTVETGVYDEKHKLISTSLTQMNGDKPVSTEVRNVDNTLVTEIKYDKNGEKSEQKEYNEDGSIKSEGKYSDGKIASRSEYYSGGKIKSKTEYYDNGVIKNQVTYDKDGKVKKKISSEIDGKFENSAQVSEGDCYLMATINGIRQTDKGQKLLENLVTISKNDKGEKIYTVDFPGAKVAALGLKNDDKIDPKRMYITGSYTFTESEMQEILKQAGKKYSLGDGDVILLEAAFEKYRKEVEHTMKANNISENQSGLAGLQTGTNTQNILAGGFSEDPTFILTGLQSSAYSIYRKVPYGLSGEALHDDELTVVPVVSGKGQQKLAVSEIDGSYETSKKELNNMLDNLMNDSKDGHIDNVAVASFKIVHDNGKISGHAITVKSVTADTVTMVNPWHPDKELTMTRKDFMKSVGHLTVADTSKHPLSVPQKPDNNHAGNNSHTNNNVSNNNTNQSGNNQHIDPAKVNYTVPQGQGYTTMIKQALVTQGISPTPENIRKAKAQFEAANPGAVHTYKGKRQDWKGNKYLIANSRVNIPNFNL